MGLIEDIAEQMRAFSERFGPAMIVDAKVVSVNEDDDTLECELPGGDIVPDVRLKSLIKAGNKLVIIPPEESVVMIGRIRNSEEWILISCDEVAKLVMIVDDVRYEIDEQGFLLQKGDDDLREVITLMIEAVQQIVVINGKNPDYAKLATAKTKAQNLLRNGTE